MIKAANVAKGSKMISKQRPQIIDEVWKLLFIINDIQMKGYGLCEALKSEKAPVIHVYLAKKFLGANS